MDFDRFAKTYGEKLDQSISYCSLTHDFFTRVKAAHLCAEVETVAGRGAQPAILDLGCGGGLTDVLLKGRFQRLQGLDVSHQLIEQARLRNPEVPYSTYDGTRSNFPDSTFDFVFAICVWHHVPPAQWHRFAAECFRLTRPGGTILVYEHNPYNPLTRLTVARCEFDADAALLTPSRIRTLLTEAGFTAGKTEFLIFLPFDRPWCRALEARLLRRIPLGAQFVVSARK